MWTSDLRWSGLRRGWHRVVCLLGAVGLIAALAPAGASAAAPTVPFQPIAIQRINLPAAITSAGFPVFTHDGKHLLFYSTAANTVGGNTGTGATAQLWIVGLDGSDPHCLSCGLANDPDSQGEGEITPFPDGKRVFFGSFFQPGFSDYGILDCEPSLIDCQSSHISTINFSAAQPAIIPPGGAAQLPQTDIGGDYAAKLSPDGHTIAFSDIRTDSIETMIIGTLTQTGDSYAVTDPKVLNPSGPTSATDPSVADWSNGGALYEFKTFTDGGADATYVQVGGAALQNPDVWSINLATGVRTRLTSNADYDEDNAVSPNGQLLALWSNRTEHLTDWLGGLLPVRDFIDEPSSVLATGISSSNKRCSGPIWVMPASGDDGGQILGQPIIYDKVPNIFVTNNLVGWPQWSPDGTMLALNTTNSTPGSGYPAHAPFLLVAHFTALKPTTPLAPVSSQPGAWAVSPTDYHPDFGFDGNVTLHGPGGGTVSLSYLETSGVLSGDWSETYDNYSDNGRDFVNGSVSITGTIEAGQIKEHLTMTGADTGNDNVDLTLGTSVSGSGESTYDGNTVRGPSAEQAAKSSCPDVYPKEPALAVTVTPRRGGAYRLKVTSSLADGGTNEGATQTEPVRDATITLGNRTTHTNAAGIATVTPHGTRHVMVSAGDTLIPTTAYLRCPAPSGALAGSHLGPVSLGSTRAVAGRALGAYVPTGSGFEDYCLDGGPGIRVAYAGARLVRPLSAAQRRGISGRIVLALSANQRYSVYGIHPGSSLATVILKFNLPRPFRVGTNAWYVLRGSVSNYVLEVQAGTVSEVGIADASLTRTRAQQRRFLESA